MRVSPILAALATSITTLPAQTRFDPSSMYHAGFSQILAFGEKLDLSQDSDSGRVPLAGRLFTITHPGACVAADTPCRVVYAIVIHGPDAGDGPAVWMLGVAGQLDHAEWLPPSADMNPRLARLRLHVASMDHRPGDGTPLERVEFQVGFNSTRVRDSQL